MEKEFVPYELALRMKELGFDEPCFGWYSDKNIRISGMDGCVISSPIKNSSFTTDDEFISSPTFSQAFRWFREKHSLHVNINPMADSTQHGFIPNGKYSGTIDDVTIGKEMIATDTVCLIPVGDTYEEAELACLDKLLEIVEQKEK